MAKAKKKRFEGVRMVLWTAKEQEAFSRKVSELATLVENLGQWVFELKFAIESLLPVADLVKRSETARQANATRRHKRAEAEAEAALAAAQAANRAGSEAEAALAELVSEWDQSGASEIHAEAKAELQGRETGA
jgi:hypothetical protein